MATISKTCLISFTRITAHVSYEGINGILVGVKWTLCVSSRRVQTLAPLDARGTGPLQVGKGRIGKEEGVKFRRKFLSTAWEWDSYVKTNDSLIENMVFNLQAEHRMSNVSMRKDIFLAGYPFD